MKDLLKIVNFVTKTNWLLLMASSSLAMMIAPTKVSLGVLLGRSEERRVGKECRL